MIKIVLRVGDKTIINTDFTDQQAAIAEAISSTSKLKYPAETSVYRDDLMVAWINHYPPTKRDDMDF